MTSTNLLRIPVHPYFWVLLPLTLLTATIGTATTTPPNASLIVGGELWDESAEPQPHSNPYIELSWIPVSEFAKSSSTGFLGSFLEAASDWSIPTPSETGPGYFFEVQQARDAEFSEPRTLYRGLDRSTIVTGMEEGDYFFRVRTVAGLSETTDVSPVTSPWSTPYAIKVQFPSMTEAVALFSLGLFVTLATIITIMRGHARHKREFPDSPPPQNA